MADRADTTDADKTSTSDAQSDGTTAPATGPFAAVGGMIAKIMALKPVRVMIHYGSKTGPLMASGLAFQGIFATFAGIWVAFSVLGLVLADDLVLRNSIIESIGRSVPGLIDTGDGSGAIDPDVLLETGAITWTGSLALAGLLFTAIGFLASARDAVRRIFSLDPKVELFILQKAKDLGLAVAFGAAILVSTVLSLLSTAALGAVLDFLGIGSDSTAGTVLGTLLGLLIVLALDTVVLAALYRILSGIPIPRRRLLGGALIGGVGLGVLKALAGVLVGNGGNNPLLASFAIIVGLLLFFNLICQVMLIAAAWIAVGMHDAGIAADPVAAEKERLERERIAELERIAARAQRPSLFARVFGRKAD